MVDKFVKSLTQKSGYPLKSKIYDTAVDYTLRFYERYMLP